MEKWAKEQYRSNTTLIDYQRNECVRFDSSCSETWQITLLVLNVCVKGAQCSLNTTTSLDKHF